MVDLPKAPDPFDEMTYGAVKPSEKRKSSGGLRRGIQSCAPLPPPSAPPAEEYAWVPKPPIKTAGHYDYYWACEPETVSECDLPAKEPGLWLACDTPAADAKKEDAVEAKAREYEAIVEVIPDKTDWDFISPAEPEPSAEPSDEEAPPIYDRP